MNDKSEVIVVHHVDTEGPLWESKKATIDRVNELFSVDISYNVKLSDIIHNRQIRSKAIENPDIETSLKKILSNDLLNTNRTTKNLTSMLNSLFNDGFQSRFFDSYGNNYSYTWHILDHTGFRDNPRKRLLGHHRILDIYEKILRKFKRKDDEIQFHFHPVPISKSAHHCSTNYTSSNNQFITNLVRRAIDRNRFPSVYRPGFHAIRPDIAFLLESWIPFDASNQSISEQDHFYCDTGYHQYGDWNGAPNDWTVYHPDIYEWRKKGNSKRQISRVLNLNTRFRNINDKEIEKAFLKASKHNNRVILGVTNHDFRNMLDEQEMFYSMLLRTSKRYNSIPFRFSSSNKAFCLYNQYQNKTKLKFAVDFDKNTIRILVTQGRIFGRQPFFCFKTNDDQYFFENLDFPIGGNKFYYTFNNHNIQLSKIQEICIVSNDCAGGQLMVKLWMEDSKIKYKKSYCDTWKIVL